MQIKKYATSAGKLPGFSRTKTSSSLPYLRRPRMMRFARKNGANILEEFPEELGHTGGHRLWSAPEIRPVTYTADNGEVKALPGKNSQKLIQAVDPRTGLAKEMTITPSKSGGFRIRHRISDLSTRNVDVAAWAITMVRGGGTAEDPFPPPSGLR